MPAPISFGAGNSYLQTMTSNREQAAAEFRRMIKWILLIAVAMVGNVMWELTEPLDDLTLFARFLAEKGEGIHHIAVATPNFAEVVADHTADGTTLPLSGSFAGVDVAYLPTGDTLGVILEVFSGMPGEGQ